MPACSIQYKSLCMLIFSHSLWNQMFKYAHVSSIKVAVRTFSFAPIVPLPRRHGNHSRNSHIPQSDVEGQLNKINKELGHVLSMIAKQNTTQSSVQFNPNHSAPAYLQNGKCMLKKLQHCTEIVFARRLILYNSLHLCLNCFWECAFSILAWIFQGAKY